MNVTEEVKQNQKDQAGVKWTAEQQQVIDTREKNILVSAAAGSGKTAVLVARILKMITDPEQPVDIDRLLIVTFTNAAAAEMRDRIRGELERYADLNPENEHLQRQLVLIHNAKITTIHSFCLNILRNHFQTAGLDPSFRVADEGEIKLMEQDALAETLREAYEEPSEEFIRLLEKYTTGKYDSVLEDVILQIYHASLGQPDPETWLKTCMEPEVDLEKTDWIEFVLSDTRELVMVMQSQMELALDLLEHAGIHDGYETCIQKYMDLILQLSSCGVYTEYAALLHSWSHPTLRGKKSTPEEEAVRAQVKELRDDVKDCLEKLKKIYFFDDPEQIMQEQKDSTQSLRALVTLVLDFMDRLRARKMEHNLVDFSDMEHYALRVLEHPAAALEYAENFEEIMIDEYQDSNLVQEEILKRVSGKGQEKNNLFMVGDVKQSIYRFRLARPDLFMEKYDRYQTDGKNACRIDLHKNFRSREEVLTSVNYIFAQIMKRSLGGVEYDRDAALYPGREFASGVPQTLLNTEIILTESTASEKQQEEAALIGKRILELVGDHPVWDQAEGRYRPARYSDIVILLRTVSGWADVFGEVLSDMGIPCFCGSQKGYFSATEIRTVLSYLQILDNPIQDIPLAAVLHSPMGDFTEEEMAKIRIHGGDISYYECCMWYLDDGPDDALRTKLQQFFEIYESLRKKCAYTPVHELLWELLDVTKYGEYAQALPGGEQRKANLDMLIEKAIAYEATSYRGLYHFVRYIENIKKYEVDYGEANIGSEGDNTVRIMSIHKSKGLEFPIVFVGGMGKQFNDMDSKNKVVIHADYGIGCDYVDEVMRVRRPSLLKTVIQRKLATETLGEELRILYVALTRAKEKLILTGSVKNASKTFAAWCKNAPSAGRPLAYSVIAGARNYFDWVMPSVLKGYSAEEIVCEEEIANDILCAGCPQIEIHYADEKERAQAEASHASLENILLSRLEAMDLEQCYDERTNAYLDQILGETYPYESENHIPGKVSVSELKKLSHETEETESEQLYMEETVIPLIPSFKNQETEIAGAARGTIYHAFMEGMDFGRAEALDLQLEEMISCGKMSREQAQVINLEDIQVFLGSEVGKRMCRAAGDGMLFREKPFVLGVKADTIKKDWNADETVLVQGIIDAYFIEESGNIVLLDYKTDKISSAKILVDKYRAQLDYYAMALERLTGRKVENCYIYSFYQNRQIQLW